MMASVGRKHTVNFPKRKSLAAAAAIVAVTSAMAMDTTITDTSADSIAIGTDVVLASGRKGYGCELLARAEGNDLLVYVKAQRKGFAVLVR